MERRKFLQKISGTTALLALAGCTSNTSASDAAEQIEAARDALLQNEDTFEQVKDFQGESAGSFDPEQIRIRVERANEHLDKAEEVATEEQQPAIDALRDWGEFQIERAEAVDLSIRLVSKWDTVSTYLSSESYEEAQGALGEAESIYDDLQTATEEMLSTYERVDRDALEEGGFTAYHDQLTNWFSKIQNWQDVIEIFFAGMEPLLSGFIAYQDGTSAFQSENFQEAERHFGSAETDFAIAEDELEALENHTTDFPTLEANTVRMICTAGALREASRLMTESAQAATRGNYSEARSYAEQARSEAGRCSS